MPPPQKKVFKNEILFETDFITFQSQLQAEARSALIQAKEMAHMEMELEKQKQDISPITDIIKNSFLKVIISKHFKIEYDGKPEIIIIIFYIIFYIVLMALFAFCMWVFFQTLDPRIPKWKLDESLIGTNPGEKSIIDLSTYLPSPSPPPLLPLASAMEMPRQQVRQLLKLTKQKKRKKKNEFDT